jgi:hypothetical protein
MFFYDLVTAISAVQSSLGAKFTGLNGKMSALSTDRIPGRPRPGELAADTRDAE